jgi:O-acetyl-ADP-ribose deacetylase (regulator of RNase III)
MRTVEGDLIKLAMDKHFDVIAHGCNCFNTMGAGIAGQIARIFPEAAAVDRRTKHGDKGKLGTITIAEIGREKWLTVVNCYTQYDLAKGPGEDVVDYNAVNRCMVAIAKTFPKKRVGLPMIGSGLAGGDWPRIERIIEQTLASHVDVTIVQFKK